MTGAPVGPPVRRATQDGIPVTYLRTPPLARLHGWSPETAWAMAAVLPLAAARSDLVHALHYADAWAATRTRRRRPVVLKLTGTVVPERHQRAPRSDRHMLIAALDGADEVWCNSRYAREVMSGFGRDMAVVPAGVDLHAFTRHGPRDPRPLVVCTAAPTEPRKRVVEVVAAWQDVVAAVPDARLALVGDVPASLRSELLELVSPTTRSSIEFPGLLHGDQLRRWYERAHASVAPARAEALGLSTLESLAMGTPVAGARSGATPELVPAAVGHLFDPGDREGCAAAIVATIALAMDPRTVERCRETARPYSWDVLLDEVERRHAALLTHV